MSNPKKIVLNCRTGYNSRLDALVEKFIRDGVVFVGVVGEDCARVEDIIDEIVVGNGDRNYDMVTSSHPSESVEDVIRYADALVGELAGETQVIEI